MFRDKSTLWVDVKNIDEYYYDLTNFIVVHHCKHDIISSLMKWKDWVQSINILYFCFWTLLETLIFSAQHLPDRTPAGFFLIINGTNSVHWMHTLSVITLAIFLCNWWNVCDKFAIVRYFGGVRIERNFIQKLCITLNIAFQPHSNLLLL